MERRLGRSNGEVIRGVDELSQTTIAFDAVPSAARDIVEGKVRGRLVVEIA